MNYKAPRGTHDIFGANALAMSLLEQQARVIFKKHGFEEIRTPAFEDAALFMRSIGQTTDIVEKEMYIFEDRKSRKLALRPEGTASLVSFYREQVGYFNACGQIFLYRRNVSL